MAEPLTGQLTFQYATSAQHRFVHADGMWGGVSSQGTLTISFYHERPQPPDSAILNIENGNLVGMDFVSPNKPILRELETTIQMDVNTALSFYVWLEQKINGIASIVGMSQEELNNALEGHRANLSKNI